MVRALLPALAAAALVSDAATQGPSADEIVARADAYVAAFVSRLSAVVAEERYLQTSAYSTDRGVGVMVVEDIERREFVSDFLLVRISGETGWRSFRDIREVDGRAVRDRQARLTRLFLEPWATVSRQVEQINRDWTRDNLGDPARTINNPILAVSFLQRAYQPRFRFSLRGADRNTGPDVWILEYQETARPTVLRTVPDRDLPAGGRFWIESQTGRVVRSEMKVSGSDTVTTSFRFDDELQSDIPFEMRENYVFRGRRMSGTATYSDYRRFQVFTEQKLK